LNLDHPILEDLSCLSDKSIKLLEKHKLLITLIKSEIIYKHISKYKVDDNSKKILLENFCAKNGIESDKSLEEVLFKNNLSIDELIDKLTMSGKKERYARENFESKAEARFLERKEELDIVTYKLIRVKDKFLAREIYTQLKERESSFEALAERFTEGPEKQSKGLIGPIPISAANEKLSELLRSTTKGELREPIFANNWFLIVQLVDFSHATFDEQTKQNMINELYSNWLERESLEISNDLLSRYSIVNNQSKDS